MADIVKLLPDGVANQIAAGEVIQRPASALKEILENSIDAGATDIHVVIRDSGRTLIQVTDNGCGMSPTDARMCFERHATSKIRDANDLFAIRTMGFRGEALASIAAVAQVELKTKRVEDETGTCILIEGSQVREQTLCGFNNGTSIAVKNLFYNVPARRKFLKSDAVEFRNLMEEFQRLAIAHPEITLSFYHDNRIIYHLLVTNLRTRLVNIFGSPYNERLVPLEESTELIRIGGFIGKPQFARKTRGEQYFFVNRRYIRHPYLHHAVEDAYEELIPDESFPSYFIMLEVDPATIDVNIHPTKIEVNFLHQQLIYTVLKAAVKKALGIHNLTPSLDFEQEQSLSFSPPPAGSVIKQPVITTDPDYNPFYRQPASGKSPFPPQKTDTRNWEKLYDTSDPEVKDTRTAIQIHDQFIVSAMKSGMLIIDQQVAHERILFERYLHLFSQHKAVSQQLLYPQTLHLSPQDFELINSLLAEIRHIGFEISEFGTNLFVITGVPAGMENQNIEELIETVLENFKKNKEDLVQDKKINFARSLSGQQALKAGRKLSEAEMNHLIDELFGCDVPEMGPDGRKTYILLTFEEMARRFK
ncbi:MAG: DNA mismatch repair endonuclease MutL [Lentimicrobiaceae bacterium]|nr:DNA mismatch repair endonuclease MutL [Lentimicrobiaceae bacterium]